MGIVIYDFCLMAIVIYDFCLMAIVIYDFLSDSNSNVCSISYRFTKQEKCQNFDLENEGQGQGVEERDLRHLIGNSEIHIGDLFRILATWEHTLMQKATH